MKKTILTTTLALGLGVTGFAADQNAEASEINKGELAQMAQSNSSELNNAPIHEGEYNYNFTVNGVNYSFESDGTNYTWSYGGYSNELPQNEAVETEEAPQVTEEAQPQQQVQEAPQVTEEAPQVTEEQPAQNTQQSEDVQAAAPEQSTQSTGGSTKAQFLAAGGTEAMWQNIVMPESTGNPNAVSPNGYKGLGQTKESWGTGSVQEQTKGMINYAQERYGSIDAAIQFRAANNWW
ncbi:hypothetical protein [Salinicoccus halodurans]|uniref:Transglycosylase n=1 Tax=Salinicoccus halodurans TaxID=407035 RepID=A0A0F7HHV0_9STAP|nr:hypothetical protein [Salinicoccus halodurans]AKG72816.1 hypothetical protein AAT16_00420 [Salinicoccus halodurans]SFK74592.1 hypothetical protein SAMN05216235_1448 [Salinicoccus halodurans]